MQQKICCELLHKFKGFSIKWGRSSSFGRRKWVNDFSCNLLISPLIFLMPSDDEYQEAFLSCLLPNTHVIRMLHINLRSWKSESFSQLEVWSQPRASQVSYMDYIVYRHLKFYNRKGLNPCHFIFCCTMWCTSLKRKNSLYLPQLKQFHLHFVSHMFPLSQALQLTVRGLGLGVAKCCVRRLTGGELPVDLAQ